MRKKKRALLLKLIGQRANKDNAMRHSYISESHSYSEILIDLVSFNKAKCYLFLVCFAMLRFGI